MAREDLAAEIGVVVAHVGRHHRLRLDDDAVDELARHTNVMHRPRLARHDLAHLRDNGAARSLYRERHRQCGGRDRLVLEAQVAVLVGAGRAQEADVERKSSRLGGRARTFSVHVPPEQLIDEVAAFGPDVLYGFPGHLVQVGLAARGESDGA